MKQAVVILLYLGAVVFWQGQPTAGVVDELFKHSISLGILMLVLVMLYREWKDLRKYRREQDEKLMNLTADSVETIESGTSTLNEMQQNLEDMLENIDRKFNVILEKLSNLKND